MRLLRFETPFGLFSVVWGFAAALHHLEKQPVDGLPIYPVVLLLFIFPERIWALGCFAVVHIAVLSFDLPVPANHSVLALLVDLCLLIGCVTAWRDPAAEPRRRFWEAVRGPIQATVVVVYFWAVFHKLNSSFFDPGVSCATNQLLKMIDLHGFPPLSADPSVFAFNIYLTLVLELAIVILLLWSRLSHLGLMLGLVFHAGLAWARFFDFATVVLALYLFFVPWDVAASRLKNIPRWARATFAGGGALLAATSLYYRGFSEDPRILAGAGFDLRADTLICLAWTVMICPVLFPIFRGSSPLGGHRRWRGARLAWLIPAIALANGATSYLGLKTVANFSMFSNLRTEGGRTNHFLVPAGRFFLTGSQNDLVRIHRFEANPPERWPLWLRLTGGWRWVDRSARWLDEVPGARIPLAELRRTVHLWRDVGFKNLRVVYERGGESHAPDDPYADPALGRPPFWERTLMAFRAVQEDGEESECRW